MPDCALDSLTQLDAHYDDRVRKLYLHNRLIILRTKQERLRIVEVYCVLATLDLPVLVVLEIESHLPKSKWSARMSLSVRWAIAAAVKRAHSCAQSGEDQ